MGVRQHLARAYGTQPPREERDLEVRQGNNKDTHRAGPGVHAGARTPQSSLVSAGDPTHTAPASTAPRVGVAGVCAVVAALGLGSRTKVGSQDDAGVRAGDWSTAEEAIGDTRAAGAAEHGGERRGVVGRVLGRGREAVRGAGSDEVDGARGGAAEAGAEAGDPGRSGAVGGGGRPWGRRRGGGRRRSWWEEEEVGEGKRAKIVISQPLLPHKSLFSPSSALPVCLPRYPQLVRLTTAYAHAHPPGD
ncbi:hypothetical protein C8Q79DRAFT_437864 [Trametes meyenii]|nr:hypothetical protein C8Q79DRAFT_437864 [Trametes meyenii]